MELQSDALNGILIDSLGAVDIYSSEPGGSG